MRLASLCIFSMIILGAAAQEQKQELQQIKQSFNQTFRDTQSKARAFASARQIPLEFNSVEGRHYLLVDVQNGIPVYWSGLNSEAAITTNVVNVRTGGATGLNLEGEGMTIGVWDEGLVKQHAELDSRVISTEGSDPKTHATHVTGTLIASGVNALAKGMAPKAKATTWYFDNDLSEMAGIAEAQALLVSNHSYGTSVGWDRVNNVWQWFGDPSIATSEDFRFGFYGQRAKNIDEVAFAAPNYSIVWAAGNDRSQTGDGSRPPDCNGGTGFDCIIPESVAKNIITVGAVNKVLNYTSPASVSISTFSSGGPTDDGRIKPDLVAAGVNLFSLSATGSDTYTILSGTSMATPNVAGSLLLLQELYQKTHSGAPMKAATLKALAIHTAKEAGPAPGPDYTYGWGLLDAAAAARVISTSDGVNNLIIESNIEQGKTYELVLSPKANQKITATLCWTDPAGSPVPNSLDPTNLMLVNDLDLELTSDAGVVIYPWILDPNNPAAQATRGNNFRDNVEKLEFSLPQAKPYRLAVKHKGQLRNGSQNFSLIVSYVSSSSGRVLYWVGDNGNWSDANHWSLSSGGAGSAPSPTAADVVIIDENSFDNSGDNTVTLDQPAACKALRWLRTQPSSLRSQGSTITVSKECTVAGGFTVADPMHVVAISNQSTGHINLRAAGFLDAKVQVEGGTWELDAGEVNQVVLNGGTLNITNKNISIHQLNSSSPNVRVLNLKGTQLTLMNGSSMNGDQLMVLSDNAELAVSSTVSLDWISIDWSKVNVNHGELSLNGGSNKIESISVDGSLLVNGSNQITELTAKGNAQLNLGNATALTVGTLRLNSSSAAPIMISSAGSAALDLQEHKLYCFDYLNVTNVSVNGLGVANAGTTSTISNANGWLTMPCPDVVFPSFELKYPCASGLTEFVNNSTGPISSYQWSFGTSGAESQQRDASYSFAEPGVYQVALTVSGSQQTRKYSTSITVTENTFAENFIATNTNELSSFLSAKKYQWLRDGEVIAGATQRIYNYGGQEGAFQVITYDETCNRISLPTVVTALEESFNDFDVYPIPANNWITIESTSGEFHLELKDMLGRVWLTRLAEGTLLLSVADLPNGLYLLTTGSDEKRVTRKVVVQHER